MKKTIRLSVIAVITLMLVMTGIAEARKGDTSSSSSGSKSSTSSRSNSSSRSSTSSRSTKTSKSNSSIADAAKSRQAKTAWQDYIKKHEEPIKPDVSKPRPDFSKPDRITPRQTDTHDLEKQLADLQSQIKSEKKRKKADKLTQQLAAIEKQIAEARRQQQMIAIAQTAAQAVLNRPNPPVTRIPTPNLNPAAITPVKPAPSSDGGSSWGLILFIIAGVVIFILWRRSGGTPTTNYRL